MTESSATQFLVCGKIAAGKSTLSAELAARPKTIGLAWTDTAWRSRYVAEWKDYRGARAGKFAPKGFPRNGKFTEG